MKLNISKSQQLNFMKNLLASVKRSDAKNNKSLDLINLTIIIPSYGRHNYILRQIVYWANTSAKVLIVDGSEYPLDKEVIDELSLYENIKYIHEQKSLNERLKIAADLISTPYSVLCGDDEFLIRSGVYSAIKKLESNNALSACIGQSLFFYRNPSLAKILYRKGYPHNGHQLAMGNASERMVCAMHAYNAATCYSVQRTDSWRSSWGKTIHRNFIGISELQQALVTYIYGKFDYVEDLYWLRSTENKPVDIKGKWEVKRITFDDWWIRVKYQQERDDVISSIADEIISIEGVSKNEAQVMVTKALHAYYDRPAGRAKRDGTSVSIVATARKNIGRLLERFLSEDQISNVSKFMGMKSHSHYYGFADLPNNDPRSKFIKNSYIDDEVSEIENLILKFQAIELEKK